MDLMPKEILKQIPNIKETEEEKDPIAYVKYFHPFSSYTAFLTEYDPEERLGFGLVVGLDTPELGYISLKELEEVEVRGLKMERDLYFKPTKLSEIKKALQLWQQ